MVVNPVQLDVSLDALWESRTNDTILTPPSSTSGDRDRLDLVATRTIQAGHTYVIRSVSCGRQITLLDGEVVLKPPSSLGSAYWTCVESDGWLGFRNVASGKLLRHGGGHPGIHCSNSKHNTWERVQIRTHEAHDGGYTLLMEYWGGLKPVGIIKEHGVERLDRLYNKGTQGLPWIFLEVS